MSFNSGSGNTVYVYDGEGSRVQRINPDATYLVTDESRRPSGALRSYIAEMRQWVRAAESGQPVDELIPVNVPATRDTALALKKRLDFLETEILPSCH